MGDTPQETVRELKELVVEYAKQETIEPLKGLGRYLAFGVAGALLIGAGVVFLAIGGLRALQEQTGGHLTGNYSWIPYTGVMVGSIAGAGLAWTARGRRKR